MSEPEKPPSEASPPQQKPIIPEFLTLDEVAAALRCSYAHAHALARKGKLGGFRDGARVLVWKQSLLDYVMKGSQGPPVRKGRGRPKKPRP